MINHIGSVFYEYKPSDLDRFKNEYHTPDVIGSCNTYDIDGDDAEYNMFSILDKDNYTIKEMSCILNGDTHYYNNNIKKIQDKFDETTFTHRFGGMIDDDREYLIVLTDVDSLDVIYNQLYNDIKNEILNDPNYLKQHFDIQCFLIESHDRNIIIINSPCITDSMENIFTLYEHNKKIRAWLGEEYDIPEYIVMELDQNSQFKTW
jgi:hypothetical protein